MSLINRNNLSYIYCIEQYFLSLTKKGVALSPLDYQKIKSWEKRGVPLNVVCKGIKNGIEFYRKTHGPHKPMPRSIKFCEGLVEKEFINHKRLRVGVNFRQQGEVYEKKVILRGIDGLIDKIENTIIRENNKKFKELYSTVRDRIRDLRSNVNKSYLHVYAELEEMDRFFLNEFCRLISHDELTSLVDEAETRLSSLRTQMSQEAYERTRETIKSLLLRKRYGLLKIELGG